MQAVTVAQMRALEAEANAKGLPYAEMMRRAGTACAQTIISHFNLQPNSLASQVLVLVGPGNNGGDGLVVARQLADLLTTEDGGTIISVYVWKRQATPPKDGDWPQQAALTGYLSLFTAEDDPDQDALKKLLNVYYVVDALFGAGQRGPFPADLEAILQALRDRQALEPELKVVAVDIPTGIDGDTGAALSESYVRADLTCTFAYAKPGLLQGAGKAAAGELVVSDIGFSEVGVGL